MGRRSGTGSATEPPAVRIRRELMEAITADIRARGWTQAHAARVVGITAPRMSNLTGSRLEKFSLDALVNIAEPLGIGVEVRPQSSPALKEGAASSDE